MKKTFDLIIRGGTIAAPHRLVRADIGVRNGKIAAIHNLSECTAKKVIDARHFVVLPGVIDTQVHFRDPGLTHKEDIGSGSASAIVGGVTSYFEMPNTKPSTTDPKALENKLKVASEKSWADYAFFMGATEENADHLSEWERLPGCAGIKIFIGSSTGSLLVEKEEILRKILKNGHRRVAVHAENEERLRERFSLVEGGASPEQHPVWRDEEAARIATEQMIRLANEAKRPVHILHVSTEEELPLIADNRDFITMEVTPNHLSLAAPECYQRLGSKAQMNPPVRDIRHQTALWKAIRQGGVDVIGSDHAPHTLEEKNQPYPKSPSGMPGVQTLLPVMLTHLAQGRLSIERLVSLCASNPARIYNIAGKGRLEMGYDADFVLVDLNKKWTVNSSWLKSKAGWSPYEGEEMIGYPVMTVLRGNVVAQEGELIGEPQGKAIRFFG